MAATVAVNGLEILLKFAVFMGDFYLGLFVLWGVLIAAGFAFLGPRVFKLLVLIKEAFLLSFATASSEAAYPKILDALDRFGVKRKISSFVMPMGYSFNLDGCGEWQRCASWRWHCRQWFRHRPKCRSPRRWR